MIFQYPVDITLDCGYNVIEKKLQYSHEFSIGMILMEIKRDYYLNKLIAKKHNGLIKVILPLHGIPKMAFWSSACMTSFSMQIVWICKSCIGEIPCVNGKRRVPSRKRQHFLNYIFQKGKKRCIMKKS